MVVFMFVAIPVILILAGLGLVFMSPRQIVMGKILFEFREYERGVVFRFGKYHRVAEPGWRLILPAIEKFVKYDLRTEAIDIAPQEVITKDAVKLLIDAILYIRVEDPVKAELYVEADYRKAIEEHVKGRIRNLVGGIELVELYAKIDEINKELMEEVGALAKEWGVVIVNIEMQSIAPPAEVVEAMQAQEIAERYKEAAKEEAETTKIRINALEEAAGGLTAPTLNYLYLQTLKDVADGQASKIIFPLEFSKLAENIGKGIGGGKGLNVKDLEKLATKFLGGKAG